MSDELDPHLTEPHGDIETKPSDVDTSGRPYPKQWQRAAHLYAVYGLGVVQTLLAVLGAHPNYWVVRRSNVVDIVLFLIVLVVAIPAVLIGIEILASKVNERVGWIVHLVLMVLASVAFLVEMSGALLIGRTSGAVVLLVGLALAALLMVAYLRAKIVQDLFLVLAAVPVLFVAMFVLSLPPLTGNYAPAVDVGIDDPKNIVVVVFDEFSLPVMQTPDGAIDSSRFPNFARLAEVSTWYPNAMSPHDGTLYAVPSILTGRVPGEDELPIAAHQPVNLFTVLDSTHTFSVYEDVSRLCPEDMCAETREALPPLRRLRMLLGDAGVVYVHSLIPPDVLEDLPIPPIGVQWGDFLSAENALLVDDDAGPYERSLGDIAAGERRAIEIGRFIDTIGTVEDPALHYLHVDLPHVPYTLLPDGRSYRSIGTLNTVNDGVWDADEWQRQQALARYSSSIGFADKAMGHLLDRLEDTGLLSDAMIVVASDHGVAFEEGEPRRLVSEENFGAMANVPLFIKYPEQSTGDIDEEYVDLTDILETIVTEFGGTLETEGNALQINREQQRRSTVEMQSRGRPAVSMTWDGYLENMAETRTEIAAMVSVGEGHDVLVAGIGPAPELMGVRTSSLPTDAGEGSVHIVGISDGGIDSDGKVRALIVASLDAPSQLPTNVYALVADEIIIGTAYAIERRSGYRLEFFVDPDVVEAAALRVTVVGVMGSQSDAPSLITLELE